MLLIATLPGCAPPRARSALGALPFSRCCRLPLLIALAPSLDFRPKLNLASASLSCLCSRAKATSPASLLAYPALALGLSQLVTAPSLRCSSPASAQAPHPAIHRPAPPAQGPLSHPASAPCCSCLRGAGWTPSRPGGPVWLWVGTLKGPCKANKQKRARRSHSHSLSCCGSRSHAASLLTPRPRASRFLRLACSLLRLPVPSLACLRRLTHAGSLLLMRLRARGEPAPAAPCPPTCPTADSQTRSLDLPRACPPPRARACSRLRDKHLR